MSDGASRPALRRHLLYLTAIALVLLLTYSGSFNGAFVSDDVAGVRRRRRKAFLILWFLIPLVPMLSCRSVA